MRASVLSSKLTKVTGHMPHFKMQCRSLCCMCARVNVYLCKRGVVIRRRGYSYPATGMYATSVGSKLGCAKLSYKNRGCAFYIHLGGS